MKKILLILFLSIPFMGYNQVTDNDIVQSLLDRKFYEANQILDSLGVWHHLHYPEKVKETAKVMSIENGEGTTKVFTLKLYDQNIRKVVINFRHDDRKQVEDMLNITGSSSHHVGKYSTDITFEK